MKARKKSERQRIASLRNKETEDESNARREAMRLRNAAARDLETDDDTNARRETDRLQHAAARNLETEDERNARREAMRLRNAAARNVETEDETNARRETDRQQHAVTRQKKKIGALKFRRETPSTCCSGGKVVLTPFPCPPQPILELFIGQNDDAKIFRKHARSINNAVCLTSLKNHWLPREGWQPSIIFQGRVQTRVGPLQPSDGENPVFAQLYVHDPSMESTSRFNNMVLPNNISIQERTVLQELLQRIQNCLHEVNPFVQDFIQIMEIPDEEIANGVMVISAKAPTGEHSRRYNAQTNLKEVSILTNSQSHDLVIQKRGGGLQIVSDLNPNGMPLHFTLLFPGGTKGWDQFDKHVDGKRRVTPKEFFTYHLSCRGRDGPNQDYLHMGGKLFQEWICMAWLTIENQRLEYQRRNQKALRADTYKSVREATAERLQMLAELAPREDGIYNDDHRAPVIGRKILCSSFQGGPRWYNAKFQDAMAIVREYGKPDLFITMTCNPKWPEIVNELRPGQEPQDRPDIVARVFKDKLDQLMNDLVQGACFGKVVGYLYCVEFQKRGLPHAHILLILANQDRAMTAELVDGMVVAELPPSPDDVDDKQTDRQT